MKHIVRFTLLAGLTAGLFGVSFAPGAKADSWYSSYYSYDSMPATTTIIESPYVERTVVSPAVIESPATTVIERPVVVKEKVVRSSPHHLVNFGLFPLMHLKVF